MAVPVPNEQRVFKTAWFARASARALIPDSELCKAIRQAMLGQCDDLGGGVYKKRLGRNLYRSIVVARGGRYWVYAFLFAKQDQANIDEKDLADFRGLAEVYSRKSDLEIAEELKRKKLVEICDADQAQISQ